MKIFLFSFVLFLISIVGMMIGVIMRRRPLQPCSRYATGDAKIDGVSCDLCTRFSRECDRESETVSQADGEVT
ncbi:MAG: hypothetical protein P8N76_27680 [Pirellulaceae bacterium]|nr:hypothetical protein [Pirellulaceae bacterium]